MTQSWKLLRIFGQSDAAEDEVVDVLGGGIEYGGDRWGGAAGQEDFGFCVEGFGKARDEFAHGADGAPVQSAADGFDGGRAQGGCGSASSSIGMRGNRSVN